MKTISKKQKRIFTIELTEEELAIIASSVCRSKLSDCIGWVRQYYPNIDVENFDMDELSELLNCCLQ